ncbi:diacylglycerol kinase family protein [Phenylobacterium sp.]|uniref:diacylglycerol/lipid kinase family protein n=1 Tax=Phenylobacterium sp. TaxID=1871053 RepID=UPI0025E9BE3C|nr:diacylglycerol kinase family protein [Phenylobacterium sp.]MBX3484075.1 NAD(+)/NADH kinase [Phenylobacterium sp.]
MIRAGVIWNQKSHRNRGGDVAPLPGVVVEVAPEEPAELFASLRRFAEHGVDLVVVDGGDGTIREVITRLPEAYREAQGGRLPRLAIVPNGKTNALALDIGSPLGTTLEQLLAAAEAGRPTKRRRCLEIVRAGQPAPERRGFLFGTGAFVRATELAQKHHSIGLFDDAAIAVTIVQAAVGALFGGSANAWRQGEAVEVSFDPAPRWFLTIASTLKRFPLGLKPFGEPREGLKTISVQAPPRRLHRALPVILGGRDAPWLAEAGYRRDDLTAFDMSWSGDFVLDGEIYGGGELTVRQGPELEFVIP